MVRFLGLAFFLFGAALIYFSYLSGTDGEKMSYLGYIIGGLFVLIGGWMVMHRRSRPAIA